MTRPTFSEFKEKALDNAAVKEEYAHAIGYDIEINFVPE